VQSQSQPVVPTNTIDTVGPKIAPSMLFHEFGVASPCGKLASENKALSVATGEGRVNPTNSQRKEKPSDAKHVR